MRNPIKILITGAGGAGTIEIIKSLKKIGGYYIIACDANPNAYGLRIADKGYVISLAIDTKFLSEIDKIVKSERPDYIIPLVDEEIMQFHLISKDSRMLCPSPLFCKIALDKWLTYLELEKNYLPTPKTMFSNYEFRPYACVVKARHGHGSKQRKYYDHNENIREQGEDWIVQERIFGKEFTVSVVVSLDGELFAVVSKEVIDKRGITMLGVTRDVPEIISLCKELVEKMNPMGPFNVQLMMDKDNQPWIFEINPRYSTTVALTIAAGVNEVDAVIRSAEGEKIDIPIPFIPNLIMNRYYTQDYYLE